MASRIQHQRITGITEEPSSGISGELVVNPDSARVWTFRPNGSKVIVSGTRPISFGAYYPGVWTNNEIILKFPVVNDMFIKDIGTISYGHLTVAPTGTVGFTLLSNGIEWGTMVFDSQTSIADFTQDVNPKEFETGDIISVVAPPVGDPTAADLTFVIGAERYPA